MQITINEDEYQELVRVKREYEKLVNKIKTQIELEKPEAWQGCEAEQMEKVYLLEELLK